MPDQELIYKIVVASFVMPLLLSAALIWFVITYQKKKNQYQIDLRERKLKEQQLIIEKQHALEEERNRIAAEMHDDLGSGLTTINFLSQKAIRNQDVKGLEKIATKANELVQNMSEIIWAMNSRFDDSMSFVAYLRRYASDYLSDHEIEYSFNVDDSLKEAISIRGEERRNLFLVFKELLHNAVKYSGSTYIIIDTGLKSGKIFYTITEVGNIVEVNSLSREKGNGLVNIMKRLGAIEYELLRRNDTDGLKATVCVLLDENI